MSIIRLDAPGRAALQVNPAMFFFDIQLDFKRFFNPVYAGNVMFLGLGAPALCFVTWT